LKSQKINIAKSINLSAMFCVGERPVGEECTRHCDHVVVEVSTNT